MDKWNGAFVHISFAAERRLLVAVGFNPRSVIPGKQFRRVATVDLEPRIRAARTGYRRALTPTDN
jgi:hypothetical protein